MEQARIDRINELAKKAREEGLTPEEIEERAELRAEYVAAFKNSLTSQLNGVYNSGKKTVKNTKNKKTDKNRYNCSKKTKILK